MREISGDQILRNPAEAYPKPPFEKQCQREGADVAINYHPNEEEDAKEVVALIRDAGRKGAAIPGDLRGEAFCTELVRRAVRELDGLDIVVSNAARQQSKESILDISTEEFDATMKANLYAPFWIIKAALPHLKPGSVTIGTASEQAYDPSPELYDYAQTKAATRNFVKSLAKQLAKKGHPRQRRCARADLDPASGQRRCQHGKAGAVRKPNAHGPPRTAGRTRLHLCAVGCRRRELRHGTDLRLVGRRGATLNHVRRCGPSSLRKSDASFLDTGSARLPHELRR
jgi:hypothetical protein